MFHQIKAAADRSRETLLADALGAVSLMSALVIGLHLPGVF